MARYRFVVSETAAEEDYPLRSVDLAMEIEVRTASDAPEAARRRVALEALRRIAGGLEGADLEPLDAESESPTETRPPRPVNYHAEDGWIRPAGIDMRIVKSAHKVVEEVARRGEKGRAVLASELVQDGLVSAPTMSRLLRNDETAGQYIEPYLLASNAGRTKALDLTPKGRLLASKIRAGVVPS